jgi:Regulator of chromosome condensation (RCC1) repeat
MVTTTITSGVRYSGIWNLAGHANAKALGTWMATQFLYSWGINTTNGQLGQNNTTNRSSPVQVGSLTTWLNVSAGGDHTAGVTTYGNLWTWGANSVVIQLIIHLRSKLER